ncbi:MAG: type 4a pilus biogenesis protein PilO [Deltaproteobacteria bacterium]|nr:type 4a pilus biogenesis protein PilO [Deltaproteobacteria bacterium]MCL5879151.1 type 4a pilus biogenesis protein PilO [Deltaproteobacteria bacterium]
MDININTLAKLNLQQKLLVLGIILILILLLDLYVWPGYLAERNNYTVLQEQERSVQAKVLETQAIADHKEEFQNELNKLSEQLNEALTKLPNNPEVDKYLVTLNTLSKTTELNVVQIEPKAEVVKGFYAEIPVQIHLTGTYDNIAVFLYKLAELQRIINVSDLDLKVMHQTSTGKTMLDAAFLTNIFRFVESAPAAAAAGKKR